MVIYLVCTKKAKEISHAALDAILLVRRSKLPSVELRYYCSIERFGSIESLNNLQKLLYTVNRNLESENTSFLVRFEAMSVAISGRDQMTNGIKVK